MDKCKICRMLRTVCVKFDFLASTFLLIHLKGGHSPCRIKAGTPQEAGQCDIVVITAGAKQKKGTSLLHTLV
jgi:hypothetical protein